MYAFDRIIKLKLLQYYATIGFTLLFYAVVLYVSGFIWSYYGFVWVGIFFAAALSFLIGFNVINIRLINKVHKLAYQDKMECLTFIKKKSEDFKDVYDPTRKNFPDELNDNFISQYSNIRKVTNSFTNRAAKMDEIFMRLRKILEHELEKHSTVQ